MMREKSDSDLFVMMVLGPALSAKVSVEAWRQTCIVAVNGDRGGPASASMNVDELDVLISALRSARKTMIVNGAEE